MFLALVFLCLSPLRVMGEARAIAILDDLIMAGGVLLIGTILAASGVKFLSQTDLLGASRTLLDKIRETDPSTWTGLSRIIAPLCAAGVKGSEYVLRLSQDLWDKVVGHFVGDVILPDAGVISGGWSNDYVFPAGITSISPELAALQSAFNSGRYRQIKINNVLYSVDADYGVYSGNYYAYADGVLISTGKSSDVYAAYPRIRLKYNTDSGKSDYYLALDFQHIFSYNSDMSNLQYSSYFTDIRYFKDLLGTNVAISVPFDISFEGTPALPDNTTHTIALPDMPTMADDGSITYPDLPLNPEANLGQVADLPGYSDVATVPLDLPINAETGKVITDIPDVPDVPDVPDIPAVSLGDILAAVNAATSAVGSIADALSQVPTMPSPGDLSLPALVVSKFPFCLPFDAYRLITLLDADPVAPSFEIPFKVGPIDEVMTFDFSYFDKAIQVFRWFEQITFVGALLYATRNFIKW